MRCVGIKKDKCWKGINLELTSHSIRLLMDFLHIDVVHMTLLKRVWLVGSISLLFWALICIVPSFLALETFNLTDVSLSWMIPIAISTMVTLVSTLVAAVITIVVSMMFIAIVVTVTVVGGCYDSRVCGIQNLHYLHQKNACETIQI